MLYECIRVIVQLNLLDIVSLYFYTNIVINSPLNVNLVILPKLNALLSHTSNTLYSKRQWTIIYFLLFHKNTWDHVFFCLFFCFAPFLKLLCSSECKSISLILFNARVTRSPNTQHKKTIGHYIMLVNSKSW